MLRAINLTCESRINPLGLDSARPRFSWQLSAAESVLQSAYRIMVFQEDDTVPFWDSGRVNSKSSVLVPYDGPALRPRTRYYWQVCIWDQKGRDSLYSERAWWETGLMKSSGFIADWITTPGKVNQEPLQPVTLLRRSFVIRQNVVRARLYASALGVYSLSINGRPVSGDLLSPGWTSYSTRIQYQTWDVSDLLVKGDNVITAELADGWYRGYLGGGDKHRASYGQRLGLICQMHVLGEDGRESVLLSNENWKVWEDGPARYADFYMGTCYDARKELPLWECR